MRIGEINMRILMLGNSYIFTNDLPSMLAEITGAEVEIGRAHV